MSKEARRLAKEAKKLTKEAKKLGEGGRGFLNEFKKFILRGNVVDLAVGVIIGAAFKDIVNSLVDDVIMPLLSLVVGKMDYSSYYIALDGNTYETIEQAKAHTATLNYGTFLTNVLNFLIMAFIIFMFVKIANKITHKKEEKKTKKCPYCFSEIPKEATRCGHCTSVLKPEKSEDPEEKDEEEAE